MSQQNPHLCQVTAAGLFEVDVNLPPGSYEYKFLMNGMWCLDHTKPTTTNEDGVENNLLIVSITTGKRSLNDLRVPPSNWLEALKGERQGQHSIRINDQ